MPKRLVQAYSLAPGELLHSGGYFYCGNFWGLDLCMVSVCFRLFAGMEIRS